MNPFINSICYLEVIFKAKQDSSTPQAIANVKLLI